jgi:hypothetical protein
MDFYLRRFLMATLFNCVTHRFVRLSWWRSGANRVPLRRRHGGLPPPSPAGSVLAPARALRVRLSRVPSDLWRSHAAAPPPPCHGCPTLRLCSLPWPGFRVVGLLHLHRADIKTSSPLRPLPSSVRIFEKKQKQTFRKGSTLGRSPRRDAGSRDLATRTPAPGHISLTLGTATRGYTCVPRPTDPFMKGSCPV